MGYTGTGWLPSLQGVGHESLTGTAYLPMLTSDGTVGLTASIFLPMLTSSGTARIQSMSGDAYLPMLKSSGRAFGAILLAGRASLPVLSSVGAIYYPVHASGSTLLPRLNGTGRIDLGLTIRGASFLPFLQSAGLSLNESHFLGSAYLPFLSSFGYARIIPVSAYRKATVMNIDTNAISHYQDHLFNSMGFFNGLLLGVSDDPNQPGIFIIDEGNDLGEPINVEIDTGTFDFAQAGVIQKPHEVWLAGRWDVGLQVETKGDEATWYPGQTFEVIREKIREQYQKLGKGIKARFFTFRIRNVSGSDFDIHSLRILGEQIKRKTR